MGGAYGGKESAATTENRMHTLAHTHTRKHSHTHQQANQSQRIIDMVAAASVGGQFAAAAATAATTTGSIVSCQNGKRGREVGERGVARTGAGPRP